MHMDLETFNYEVEITFYVLLICFSALSTYEIQENAHYGILTKFLQHST